MKRWRTHIICLLLVTLPASLWAAVAAPGNCSLAKPMQQAQADSTHQAHHGMAMDMSDASNSGMGSHVQPGHDAGTLEPCCDTCVSACLANNLSALNLQLATLEPVEHGMHYRLDRATQFLAGPSYPSLYRPPISQS
jgi:hypothetical protein